MKRNILLLAFAFMGLASYAQMPIAQKNVPQVIQNVVAKQCSEKALKKTVWIKIENDYEGNYENQRFRINDDAQLIWDMKYVEYTELPTEAYQHFKKKYDAQYRYESAWAVNQVTNDEKMYFIVGINGHTPYYFKYNDENQMVEKVACGIDFKFNKYKHKPKPVVVEEVLADTLSAVADTLKLDMGQVKQADADTLQIINNQEVPEAQGE